MPVDLDEQFLKGLYQNLADRPLEPDHPFRVAVYDRQGAEDPVDSMSRHIRYTDVQSMQMFSGFRGSGKTTELFRLRKDLEERGYVVLYGDALEYLNPAEPIDISNLLIVLAGAFSDALREMEI